MSTAKSIKLPNLSPYEQVRAEWLKRMKRTDPLVDCPDCDGEGETHTEYCSCGQEVEKTCSRCNGGGKIHFSELDAFTIKVMYTHREYLADAAKDIEAWSSWIGENPAVVAAALGYTSFSRLVDRGLTIISAPGESA